MKYIINVNVGNMKDNKKVFWLNDAFYKGPIDKKFEGGYYFRAFDLVKFMERVEHETGDPVVGLCFEGNNVDIIVEKTQINND